MNQRLKTHTSGIMVTALILFLLEIITFPIVVYFTYADRSESLCHIITYEDHELNWDKNTDVRKDGTARLSLFDKKYRNAESDNGDDIIMPGEHMTSIIRLMNNDREAIRYTAVLYRKVTDDTLPVDIYMDGAGLKNTGEYPLPEGVKHKDVIRAVSGKVKPMKLVDFDLSWIWNFHEDDLQDIRDTEFGNKAAQGKADKLTAGFYIVVESKGGGTVLPEPPKTGDDTILAGYVVLMIISGIVLILLFIDERKRKNEKNSKYTA